MKKVVALVQTPPPFGGQALMMEKFLSRTYADVELHHVPMSFAKDMSDIGRIKLRKVLELFRIPIAVLRKRISTGADVLYYGPCGPNLVPVIRDVFLLTVLRPFFRRVIFHFHAAGISEFAGRVPFLLRPLFNYAYQAPDIAIYLSDHNPADHIALRAKKSFLVPNGIEDLPAGVQPSDLQPPRERGAACTVLFVGVLTESKGVGDLIRAAAVLPSRLHDLIKVRIVGRFESRSYEEEIRDLVASLELEQVVELAGPVAPSDIAREMASADIFCIPTFFQAESFSLVVAEAMRQGLPVIATRWRGLQSLVVHGESGYLVDVHDLGALSIALQRLVEDPELCRKFGRAGRDYFERELRLPTFFSKMQFVFDQLST